MKKLTAIFLCILLVFSIASCGDADGAKEPAGTPTNTTPQPLPSETQVQNPNDKEPTPEPDYNDGKTLIVYYSASGNTKTVADYIAAATNGDLFELVPVNPYSNADLDWTDDDSRVVYEHDHSDAREIELVESSVPDWESYNTVFIGYPIWWGIAAWPVNGFIAANDFTGKTVIPFCTSSSSGLGESGELLKEAAGTGNWLEGIRFSSRASEETVKEWVEGLDLDQKDASVSTVYFTSNITPEGLMAVYEALGWTPQGNVAVKPPASNYLDPQLIKNLVQSVNASIVECNTTYGGSRTETAMHF